MSTADDVGYKVIKGRRWRCSNPAIPENLRQQLVNELMDARRSVKAALRNNSASEERAARARVHCAKVALGERGGMWWLDQSADEHTQRIDATVYSLLKLRSPESTLCPSEVARVIGGDVWRQYMESVRVRAWQLSDCAILSVKQKGSIVERGVKGPLRLARGSTFEHLTTYVKTPS